ncbi:MAG: type II toxin-antitoxin system VapC family toxin [Burkholderiales bacterium]
MLVDTDVIIWNWRGSDKAAQFLATHRGFYVSAVSYMELVQGMRNRRELKRLQSDLKLWAVTLLPVTELISAHAVTLLEQHFFSHSLQMADAMIAATALQHKVPLATGNYKHFKAVKKLKLEVFSPHVTKSARRSA